MGDLSREQQAQLWWREKPHWPADCPCEECSPNSWRNVHGRALEEALGKVNEIRNSIIGCQTVNWSEHVYPLVAALDAAGLKGLPYPEARANVGTMLERTLAAESRAAALSARVEALEGALRRWGIIRSTYDDEGREEPGRPFTRCRSCGVIAWGDRPLKHRKRCDVAAALAAPAVSPTPTEDRR